MTTLVVQINEKNNTIYSPINDKWYVLTPEEKVRQKYVCRLVNSYGYSLELMAQEVQVNNSQRGQGRAMADIAIWKSVEDKRQNNSPIIIVECKAEHVTIQEEDYFQGYNYASWAGADFFVTTNLKETKVFRVLTGKIPKKLEEIIDIPDYKTSQDKKAVDKLLMQTKAFTRDEFSRLLFKCHNIIRNNDKLSPEAAFDEISKILFIKIRYERENKETQIFSKNEFVKLRKGYDQTRSKDSPDFYQILFERTKDDFKDDDLFDPSETIRIRENSFESIVKELEIYNLSTTSDDVKGIAFEQFLGRTFRGELGQFFTPRTLVDFMVEVLNPEEGEIICDPCCGSGGFLIKAFEYVRDKIEQDILKEKEELKTQFFTEEYEGASEKIKEKIDQHLNDLFGKLNQELDINNSKSRLHQLSHNCIYGVDANPRMSRTAKMNMIMHGDGHGGVHHNDGLLNVNGIFENRFDVILTNPPFGSRVERTLKITEADKYQDQQRIDKYKKRYGKAYEEALKQVNDNIDKPFLSLFETGKMSTLTEVLFIERCLDLLKPGGRMGIVLPEGVLNTANLQRVREYFESIAKIIFIVSIPQDVFTASGATVKPSIMFFKKFTEIESKTYQKIKKESEKEIEKKYLSEKEELKGLIKESTTEEKKKHRAKLRELNEKIDNEIKQVIKEKFDYEIPIAEVEKAGISTTGAKIENELEPLCEEFKAYFQRNPLWKANGCEFNYSVEDKRLLRSQDESPAEVFYE